MKVTEPAANGKHPMEDPKPSVVSQKLFTKYGSLLSIFFFNNTGVSSWVQGSKVLGLGVTRHGLKLTS